MTQAPPPPGSLTVAPLFGWEAVAIVLVLATVVAVAVVVLLQAGTDASGRSEWQAWLDGRSVSPRDPSVEERADLRSSATEADPDPTPAPGRSFPGVPPVVVRHRDAWRSPRS